MLEGHVLDVPHKILVAGMHGELLEDLDEHQAEDELDGQVAFLRQELRLGTDASEIARNKNLVT